MESSQPRRLRRDSAADPVRCRREIRDRDEDAEVKDAAAVEDLWPNAAAAVADEDGVDDSIPSRLRRREDLVGDAEGDG